MARDYNIKWRDSDTAELKAVVKQFNQALKKEAKNNPEFKSALPKNKTYTEVKNKVGTRTEYNREVAAMKRFIENKQNARQVVKINDDFSLTKWEVKEAKKRVKRLNARNEKIRQQSNLDLNGMNAHIARDMGLNNISFNAEKGKRSDWEKFVKNIENRTSTKIMSKKQEEYKKNYIKGLKNAYGKQGEKVIRAIKNLTPSQVYNMQFTSPILNIDFIYDPMEVARKINGILNALQNVK